ncbi:MAG: hypothetical protein HUJ96_01520 [Marinilabiliaceae bacterium]|nr:hypothetical protein [Marinilabiliaceae bacterium]
MNEEEAQAFAQIEPVSKVFMPSVVHYTIRSYIDIDLIIPVGWTTPQTDDCLMKLCCVENAPKGTEPPPKKVVEPKPI